MENPVWLTVLISLFSGFAAYAVSTYFYIHYERRKEKLSVLRAIMANRYGLTSAGRSEASGKFFQALNEAFAVFHNSRPVIEALKDFSQHKFRTADNVTQLIRRMSEDLKIDTSYLEDDFFNTPFVPGIIDNNTHNKQIQPTQKPHG